MTARERKAVIFGGNGSMGKITKNMFENLGFETIICERETDSSAAEMAIKDSLVVFFSVKPIPEINRIISDHIDVFQSDHIVLDNASVKNPLIDSFDMLDKKGVSVCSTHPLCKDDQPLHGQNVLLMDIGHNPNKAHEVAKLLYGSSGMVINTLSIDKHDGTMTIMQLVPHVVMRAVAKTFVDMGIDLEGMDSFTPANFQLFGLSLFRTALQDPEISAMLIKNLSQEEEGKKFLDKFQDNFKIIIEEANEETLAHSFAATKKELGSDDFKIKMNEKTTFVLENLANLKVLSITLEIGENKAGTLIRILKPFKKEGISLTAIISHTLSDGRVRFKIGVDEKTVNKDSLKFVAGGLNSIGCTIV